MVDDPIAELAFKLDRFSEDFDPYDYKDQVEDPAAHVQQIQDDLRAGNFAPYRTFLENAVMDAQEKRDAVRAGGLLKALDKVEQKPSVREHLVKLQEQAPAAKPSRKHKERER